MRTPLSKQRNKHIQRVLVEAAIKPQDDTVKVMSYLEAQATEFPQPPKPLPYFATSLFLPELNETAIAAITTATQDAPQRFRVMIWHLHGAVTPVPSGDMAFPLRERGHELQVRGDWDTPGEEATAVQWRAAETRGSRGFRLDSEQWVPLPKRFFQFVVENLGPGLQNQVRPA